MSWLKDEALKNIAYMVLTPEVSHAPMSWSKAEATTPLTAQRVSDAGSLMDLKRFEEASSLLRKTIPVARRVVGTSDRITLTTRWTYAMALYEDPDATLDDVREAVATLEDAVRIGRRVLGGAHPMAAKMEKSLQISREALRARESGQNVVFNPR